MTTPYSFVIGLEIHVELATRTKMFCRCLNDPFNAQPNQHTCPVCLGLPGTLPVPNKEAVRMTILAGLGLGSEIATYSKWDRKHYFYPDLPKGYQISQYDLPLCKGGELALLDEQGEEEAVIRFERIHLEEDAGKLLHTGKTGYSRVDLNRAGVPLMEMVTKPDLTSPVQARRFMQELRLLVRALGISEADMEKGQMRCDVNVSLKFEHAGVRVWTPITEIKNVNSTRSVERSLLVEGQRLYQEWLANGPVRERKNKLTAGWDEEKGIITIHRTKEEANEYRYFPEPDIPVLMVGEIPELDPQKMQLPELPNAQRRRYLALGLSAADSEMLVQDPLRAQFAEARFAEGLAAKPVCNWLINAPESQLLAPAHFKELVELAAEGLVAFAAIKAELPQIRAELASEGQKSLCAVVESLGLLQVHDESMVQSAVSAVLAENPQAVQDFRAGKEKILGFLIGQVMKQTGGQAQPAKVQAAVREALEKS